MFPAWVIYIISIIGLVIGSKTDLEKREVPDFLNFTMIALGIAIGAITSVITWTIWPFLSAVCGLAVGYLVGALMYYTGQWGGGDAKMLMGLGALHGVAIIGPASLWNGTFPLFFTIIITIFIAGAIYGLGYAAFLALKHRVKFRRAFIKELHKRKRMRITVIIIVVILLASTFLFQLIMIKILIAAIAFFVFFGFHGIISSKALEQAILIKSIHVSKLVEGDWIVKDVLVKGKRICGPKDLGITIKQIEELKKHKVKIVKVKEGIPFIPGFLLGYIIVLISGNWIVGLF